MTSKYHFDKFLYELLESGEYEQFTAVELRNAYAKQFPGAQINLVDLRKHIERQVKRMQADNWVVRDKVRRKRGQLYFLKALPNRIELQLVNSRFVPTEADIEHPNSLNINEASDTKIQGGSRDYSSIQHRLQKQLSEAESKFFCSLGEIERLNIFIEEMPQLKRKIEIDLLETRKKSSKLAGHLHAFERVISIVKALQ